MAKKNDALLDVKQYLNLDNQELEVKLQLLIKSIEKKDKRLKKIIELSDKQQFAVLGLHEKLEETYTELQHYKDALEEVHQYDVDQQNVASSKVVAGIINELSNDTKLDVKSLFIPSDILSGDFYSLFKRPDGSIFFYIIDGQGHGISPSITVFAAASILASYAHEELSFQELLDGILPYMRTFLGDEEQLSFTIVEIGADLKTLNYVNGGMYPMLLKDGDEIIQLKANSLPIMDFSIDMMGTTIEIEDFKNIMLYSDGIVEVEDDRLHQYAPKKLIEDTSLIIQAAKDVPTYTRDDDITLISIEKL